MAPKARAKPASSDALRKHCQAVAKDFKKHKNVAKAVKDLENPSTREKLGIHGSELLIKACKVNTRWSWID